MSTLEFQSLAIYLGSSSSIPCLQQGKCSVNQVQEAVYTDAFYRKVAAEGQFKKLENSFPWLQFKMRFIVGMCEWLSR